MELKLCVCVCVCIERERERERDNLRIEQRKMIVRAFEQLLRDFVRVRTKRHTHTHRPPDTDLLNEVHTMTGISSPNTSAAVEGGENVVSRINTTSEFVSLRHLINSEQSFCKSQSFMSGFVGYSHLDNRKFLDFFSFFHDLKTCAKCIEYGYITLNIEFVFLEFHILRSSRSFDQNICLLTTSSVSVVTLFSCVRLLLCVV